MNSSKPLDLSARNAARARQAVLTKPPGSLGQLEELACRFAAWQGRACPEELKPAITVFAGDHGVTVEGVSAFPAEVTTEMVRNFSAGGAAICVLARALDARLEVVDVGVAGDVSALPIIHAKVRAGSHNLAKQSAMSAEETAAALETGRAAARRAVDAGANLLIAGDMGIGNTTASAALICRLTGAAPELVVGRGTGIDDSGLSNKRRVVKTALARVAWENLSGEDTLAELGGLEIAAIAGFFLEGARLGVPSLVDGFIASAAALCAKAIDPTLHDWLLASHRSAESGHDLALAALQLHPLVDLGLRLGEGSGAALCVPMLQMAVKLHNEMATFAEAGVSGKSA
ncbi:nicotinate-nucleotide--dimethylbenzimidazole phosphoribosyltransferase [Chromobacterium subtsugae]|uniref:Nicotinate-nucleotide--dimethylbenzimidazole phosphoribosyltransferase n=1 Tax=Chromobacterium subtsugae TaxID=251747 RepID=A0ABS7FII2_9NEIS|nr:MULTISPECIES: nicotinate-nucleotide--dimethylbenzimidazole phosphoribosyltransferase [Chromobacterium]KUM04375.1 nicotinate-nucleotide--dimethylbenzimidazole phosphoribosyltransferase [Chromobacterium subtsugae]KZE87392.1 nicotinate-nucleotide--dimethylbenzimidazole phosphoribosyltransferase [Chromobacterium sp. F49]MBW7566527.1 nicotinate-nucleotide--dimethylbenzimidazole phosphoribosyltransferase [Chromobacterium subtsugae]MBW8289896.1 nicotinate-nucleotide--dimethylbenzimidazole phosphori